MALKNALGFGGHSPPIRKENDLHNLPCTVNMVMTSCLYLITSMDGFQTVGSCGGRSPPPTWKRNHLHNLPLLQTC